MTQTPDIDILAAFGLREPDGTPCDATAPFADPGRFYRQAHCLGRCAEEIYPRRRLEGCSEKEVDATAKELESEWREFAKRFESRAETAADPEATGDPDELALESLGEFAPELSADESLLYEVAYRFRAERFRRLWRYLRSPRKWRDAEVRRGIDVADCCFSAAIELCNRRVEERLTGQIHEWWSSHPTVADPTVDFIWHGHIELLLAGDENLILLVFRGTEPRSLKDIAVDLDFQMVDLGEWTGGEIVTRGRWGETRTTEKPGPVKVHRGFWTALDSVWPQIREGLEGLLDQAPDSRQRVWLTGHSLGGALATVAAYRLVREGLLDRVPARLGGLDQEGASPSGAQRIGGVVTFGQPRVGNRAFALQYRYPYGLDEQARDKGSAHERHIRFVNSNDVVCRVPPAALIPGGKTNEAGEPPPRWRGKRPAFAGATAALEAEPADAGATEAPAIGPEEAAVAAAPEAEPPDARAAVAPEVEPAEPAATAAPGVEPADATATEPPGIEPAATGDAAGLEAEPAEPATTAASEVEPADAAATAALVAKPTTTEGYYHVGAVLFGNRSRGVTSVAGFWWYFRLLWRRLAARFRALFATDVGWRFANRFLPGMIDHGMRQYNRLLEKAAQEGGKPPGS